MRIAIVYLGRRGSGGAIALELAVHLAQKSEVLGVISRQAENFSLWLQSEIPVLPITTYASTSQALTSLLFQGRIQGLALSIRNFKPDVVVFPMFHPWNSILQNALHDVPSIVFVHDPVPHPGLTDRIYSLVENRSIRRASRCVILSSCLTEAVQERGADPTRVTVIPHGSLEYFRKYYPHSTVPSTQSQRLLFFGRITPYKGIDVLLEAYRHLDGDRPPLSIVGSGNFAPYSHLVKGLDGVQVVNRWIAESDVPNYFEAGSILVLPYTSASQSGVLEIAAAFALPVIATRVGGIPEQIQDCETGLLVEPGNPKELKEAMQRLISDPVFAGQLGKQLYVRSEERRSWDFIAGRVSEVCTEIISETSVKERSK